MAEFPLFFLKKKTKEEPVEEQTAAHPENADENVGSEPSRQEAEKIWFRRLLSHNIRMPMTIIAGYGDLLKSNSLETREEELQCISKICRNIDYLDTLFKVIVDDGNSEEILSRKEWFDLLDCGREAFDYVGSMTRKAHINISVNSSRDSVQYYGNRIVMMRAFYNLIENSIRYMNRPGNICMTIEETDDEVYAFYRDDGEGMDEKEAEDITKLNYQGSNGSKAGHGIGMYLVREAVESNGGSLSIRTGQGKGMGVYMSFPKNDKQRGV